MVTIKAKINYAHLLEPTKFRNERKAYYRCDVVLPREDYTPVLEISEEIKSVTGKDLLAELLKNGDDKQEHIYHGAYYFTAKTTISDGVEVINTNNRDVLDGSWALLDLSFIESKRKPISCKLEKITIL